MSDFIPASEVRDTDALVEWPGYHVVKYEWHPNGNTGRILMLDRYGSQCWTPKHPGETIEIETRADDLEVK